MEPALLLLDDFEVPPNQGYCRGAGECMIGGKEAGKECCYTLECPQESIEADKCHSSESGSRPNSSSSKSGMPSSFATEKSSHCLDDFGDSCVQEKMARWVVQSVVLLVHRQSGSTR